MNQHVRLMIASLTLATLTASITAPALANNSETAAPMPMLINEPVLINDASDLRPMLINEPVLISAGAAWLGHWAEPDLQALRASASPKPAALISGAVDPDEAMPIDQVADLLTYIYGAGGEAGGALDLAIEVGLIRPTDYDGSTLDPTQSVSRERFALLLIRALGLNGAEDEGAPRFADAAAIQPAYRAAAAMLQAEGLMIGDGEGRFSPAAPVTFAQAAKTLIRASAWRQEKAAKLAGLDPANATWLIDDQPVTLVDGVAEVPAAPGSAAKVVTRLADHLAAGDLTGDGKLDLAAVLTQQTGGTGTFFYLGALANDGSPIKAAFLGDRIAVQNVRIVEGKVVVDLLTRGADEPFVVPPHIKESRIYQVKNGALVLVEE